MSLVTCIKNSLTRLRHRRGHGVHSPLVYALYRQAFIRRDGGSETYEMLVSKGIPEKYASEMDRVAWILGPENIQFIFPGEEIPAARGGIICIIPLKGRQNEYQTLVAEKQALSIDRRGYALFIYDEALSPQHFIL